MIILVGYPGLSGALYVMQGTITIRDSYFGNHKGIYNYIFIIIFH